MPRGPRIVVPDCPHHVTQRGNNGQDVFFVDDDRRTYLGMLGKSSRQFGLRIDGYCLMSNHVHLIVTPKTEDALGTALKRVGQLYAQYINHLHGRRGHLWQDRYYSCPMDDEHFWTAMTYVERNPVRAGLCADACQWRWSSAAAHCGEPDRSGLLDISTWRRRLPPDGDWRDALAAATDARQLRALRLSTARGRPLGSDSFISKLEHLIGRRLRPLPIGRPKNRDRPYF